MKTNRKRKVGLAACRAIASQRRLVPCQPPTATAISSIAIRGLLGRCAGLALLFSTFTFQLSTARAATTIDGVNKYAWGANIGWLDWRGDTNSGAVIGEYVCSGYLYAANVGWINLGSGAPANKIQYQNNSAADFGINHDSLGNLRGYAWGANIGWLNFETNGAPKVDLFTGRMSGYVWSANCGWISLSNSAASVQTATIQKGALAPDGLPIAWLLQNFGTTNINANADADGDGVSNANEYLAGTNPNDAKDYLHITSFTRGGFGNPTRNDLIWTSQPTRFYTVQSKASLAPGSWSDLLVFSSPGTNNATFNDSGTNRFYRVRAYRPLTP